MGVLSDAVVACRNSVRGQSSLDLTAGQRLGQVARYSCVYADKRRFHKRTAVFVEVGHVRQQAHRRDAAKAAAQRHKPGAPVWREIGNDDMRTFFHCVTAPHHGHASQRYVIVSRARPHTIACEWVQLAASQKAPAYGPLPRPAAVSPRLYHTLSDLQYRSHRARRRLTLPAMPSRLTTPNSHIDSAAVLSAAALRLTHRGRAVPTRTCARY